MGHVDGRGGELAMQLRQRRPHADAELRVEVGERLVHEERLRLAHDRPPHRHALALAARELPRLALEELREAEHARDLVDAGPRLRLRRAPHLQAVAEVLADRHVRVQRVALEDHGDVALARREIRDVPPVDRDRPARHLLEAGEAPQKRRLPASGRADERDELTVFDAQRHVVEGNHVPRKDLADVLELDLRHR
jgi:hypothetical protein